MSSPSTACIAVRVISCGSGTRHERDRGSGVSAPAQPHVGHVKTHTDAPWLDECCASTAGRIFSRFLRVQELRHPNLAPYIDLYEIKGRAFLLSYHTPATLASLLHEGGSPASLGGWEHNLFHAEPRPATPDGADAAVEEEDTTRGHRRRLSTAAAVRVCLQIGHAVEYLHLQGLVHGCITPDCILLVATSGSACTKRVLLSDYGTNHLTAGSMDIFPNLEFCAPEVIAARLLCKPPRRPAAASATGSDTADVCLDPSIDMWSLGAVLLYALSALDRRLPWSPRRGSGNTGDQSYEASGTKTMCAGVLAYAGLALSDNTG